MSFATDNATAGFAKVNPIATLVPPADAQAQPQPQPVADAAHTLLAQFGTPESTQARTRSVWDMTRILTCAEFDDAMARALAQAKANDKAVGFKPADGAKGRDAYGPSQSSLATMASQCRQVFGACKIDPECIVSLPDNGVVHPDLFPNWSRAYTLARAFLADKKVDWTGNPLSEVKAAKAAKAKAGADGAIMGEVMVQHPQQPGEPMADYMARIAEYVEAAQDEVQNKATEVAAKKELTRLIKVHGDNTADILARMVNMLDAMNGEDAPV